MAVIGSADQFVERLTSLRTAEQLAKIQRYFKSSEGEYGEGDEFLGVPFGQVFALAKESLGMPLDQLELLLDHRHHEVRAGALSIMDKEARAKKTPEARRGALFDLYLRRIDRINNWDLVDLAAPFVVGGYLFDKPRDLLTQLARSDNIWERRTAIVSTAYFIRQGDLDDTFAIAEILVADPQDLIHKAVGGWLREAGKQDLPRLLAFLDRHAPTMPRTMLRYAIEHLAPEQRDHYLRLGRRPR